MEIEKDRLRRTELLVGERVMERAAAAKVILFGVGGVGSWCAESLVRSGIGRLTMVDFDRIDVTNLNRQVMATSRTIGQVKVDALKERLWEIDPNVAVTAVRQTYTADTAALFRLDDYDYIIDAIDSLQDKALLIREATATVATFFSSMGAGRKIDPKRVRVAEFWKVQGCPLGASLRRKFRRDKFFPKKKFFCVYSDELLSNSGENRGDELDASPRSAAHINGTLAHITAIFGFTLAGLVMEDLYRKEHASRSMENEVNNNSN